MNETLSNYAYGMWFVVVFNVLLFLFFAISFIKPKKRFEWRSMGAFIGFIVALFTEMYGFPLTIYLLSTWMGKSYPVLDPFAHSSGHLVLVFLGLSYSGNALVVLHLISNGIIFFGFSLMYLGWMRIYKSEGKSIVTDGVYAYVRHPQYVGIFLVTIGFLIQWPSLTTLIMWPILIFAYYRLAMREERDVERQFGEEFIEYKEKVSAFIPRLGK
ncbi:isoprenylcysteine carboxylmethyltransferase family protein [Candidatus Atribacteria bacterium MT.SAG.1]|nr:isoprenylcysteine carboxylmethyltransferase family protein [Candidatus Atribacteria bacterium MT.SAG.1]